MTNISDRITKLISFLKISTRAFEQQIGCSNGVIARCISKNTDISSFWLSKIIEVYPDIDPRWLLTGCGSILVDTQTITQSMTVAAPTMSNNEAMVYYNMYEKKDEENKALIEQIGQLKERLRVQEEKIEDLKKADVPFQKDSVGSTPIRKRGVAGSGSVQFAGKE